MLLKIGHRASRVHPALSTKPSAASHRSLRLEPLEARALLDAAAHGLFPNEMYLVDGYPYAVAAGDLNGDGRMDLVTGGDTVSVLLGRGDGSFREPMSFPVDYVSVTCVALGDLNGDGRLDVVTGSYNGAVSVLLGHGDATFGRLVSYPVSTNLTSVALGDLNGDGHLDLVVANTSNDVSIFLGQGDGTFATPVTCAVGIPPRSVALGDLNGDGYLDLATAPYYGNNVSILLGQGDGTFAPDVTYATGTGAYSVALGDLNGDGRLDLVTAHALGGSVSVLLGQGNGTFLAPVNYNSGVSIALTLADFNGDGKLDLATANHDGSVFALRNQGDGTFATPLLDGPSSGSGATVLGDLNGDGCLDMVTTKTTGSYEASVFVLLGRGDGTFAEPVDYPAGTNAYSLALGDLDGDGNLDVVTANGVDKTISVLLGYGDGTFAPAVTYPVGILPYAVALGDLNGDGNLDVAVPNTGSGTVSVLLGRGDGTFAPAVNYGGVGFTCSVALGDLNNAGYLDMVAVGSYIITYLWGQGDGTFRVENSSAIPVRSPVVLSDLNNDGWLDIVVGTLDSWDNAIFGLDNAILVALNQGGHFGGRDTFSSYSVGFMESLALGDVNGDGLTDVVTANGVGDNVSVRLGNGDGTFGPEACFWVGSYTSSVALGDLNGDGRMDVVAGGSVLLGQAVLPQAHSTTTTLESDSSFLESTYGQSVTVSATVSDDNPRPGTPTGFVQFVLDGSNFGEPVALVDGVASLSIDGLPAGWYSIDAHYISDDLSAFENSQESTSLNLDVIPAPLTIVVDNQNKLYGDALPALTASYSGFVNGDTEACLTVPVTLATTATASSRVGNYSITASGAESPNYWIDYVEGSLAVTPAPLTIKADDKSMMSGGSLPTLTATCTGLVNDDTLASLSQPPTLATAATASSPAGTYPITASGADSADYTISYVSGTLTILSGENTAVLVADPLNPGKTELSVYGTRRNDTIVIAAGRSTGQVMVSINGKSKGTFAPTSRIVVHGLAGNDWLQVSDRVTRAAWLYGDDGNDTIWSGGGPSLLLGGAGNDNLWGDRGRSILIGGTGADQLFGGSGDSLLLGGTTEYTTRDAALAALLDEWSSSSSYATRVGHLTGTWGGKNGSYFLSATTVYDDATRDLVYGGAGLDLYFHAPGDKVYGKQSRETLLTVRKR